jgi:hypothetical protein
LLRGSRKDFSFAQPFSFDEQVRGMIIDEFHSLADRLGI